MGLGLKRWRLAALNLVYPLRCAGCGLDLPYDSPSRICSPCLASIKEIPPDPEPSFVRSCSLYEGTIKELIHKFKYSGKDYLSESLVPFLVRGWRNHAEIQRADIIACVPSHPARFRERGYNQSEVLARGLAASCGRPYLSALKRARNTASQTELGREERAKNMEAAFQARDASSIEGKRVLLVDDVCTTGATLEECAKALRQAGAEDVFAITLARQKS